jgi:chromatin segregation and condensation protein Rec8/ScpA/Scc1 (kleisin family)
LLDRIRADQEQVGKKKVSAPPETKKWQYKPPETEEEVNERLEAFERALDFSQFSTKEKEGWKVVCKNIFMIGFTYFLELKNKLVDG